jgi:Ca-activated chloride channel family protein
VPTVRSKRYDSFRPLYLGAVLLACGIVYAHAQSPPPQSGSSGTRGRSPLFSKTELVVLPVRVTDAGGNFVSGLGLQDFQVYENGRPQSVALFQDGDSPVTVGLVVDHSRSMAGKLPEVAAAVSAFAQSSNPHDEMFVVDFNDDVSVEPADGDAFTNDPEILAKAVSHVRGRGRTALYDAVAEGLTHLQLGHRDRKALIIVSDGGDNASRYKYSQVLALAQQSQVVIYAVGLAGATEESDPEVLRRLTKHTGGIAFFPMSIEGIAEISKGIARDLREQYTLGFVPEGTATTDSFRQIRVKVSSPGRGKLRVRTRSGYFRPQQTRPVPMRGKDAS